MVGYPFKYDGNSAIGVSEGDTHNKHRYLLPHQYSEVLPLAAHLLDDSVWRVALLAPGFVLDLGSMVAHVEIEVRPQALTGYFQWSDQHRRKKPPT